MQSSFNHELQYAHGGMQGGHDSHGLQRRSTSEAMDSYFTCITTCSLDDGECVTRCVEELREH
jgi:hypothetical protein